MADKNAADVLEEAADLMLVHGRGKYEGRSSGGTYCVLGAMAEAVDPGWWQNAAVDPLDKYLYFAIVRARAAEPLRELAGRVPHGSLEDLSDKPEEAVYLWNDGTDADFEVIDTLRSVAKDLRNEAKS